MTGLSSLIRCAAPYWRRDQDEAEEECRSLERENRDQVLKPKTTMKITVEEIVKEAMAKAKSKLEADGVEMSDTDRLTLELGCWAGVMTILEHVHEWKQQRLAAGDYPDTLRTMADEIETGKI